MSAEAAIRRYARQEADLRAARRSGDPGALELAEHLRALRRQLQTRLENEENPDRRQEDRRQTTIPGW